MKFEIGSVSNNSGFSQSLWMEIQLPSFSPLNENLNPDICIVGSGIVGLTCAYTLAKAGKSVVVLDQGAICGGQTARTTAHLTWVLDDRYFNVVNSFGEEGARLAAESHATAIDYIEKIIKEEKIDCDFERLDGYLFVPPENSTDILEKELATIQKLGMPVKKVSKAPFPSFDTGPSLLFPKQAQFHILKYLSGLIKALIKYKVQIYTYTHAQEIKDGSPCKITTKSGKTILCQAAIMATCTPVNDRFCIHTKQHPYRTYVIGAQVPKQSIPKALYWDTPDPYHYIRLQRNLTNPNTDWLIIGGEDHKVGQDPAIDSKYDCLEEWGRLHFPNMGEVEYRWSGQVFEPVDYLAYIGKNPFDTNIYIATGDSGNGMTHGTIAGMLIPDLILGKQNPWKQIYDPKRKTLSRAVEYVEENLNVLLQYRDWFTSGERMQIDLLTPGEGVILREGLKKIAVFKDNQYKVHVNSALCPHLGGCVRWNHGEKSWDCPCHGSRFDPYGKVITGPARDDLERKD
jgi:glycine/D-amino acid oxidase-like deaminating enzyme/nitrite reductase/ring-hydroxylating ferredoxin subunit